MVKRLLLMAVCMVLSFSGLGHPPLAHASNAPTAHACQQGGYQQYVRRDGTGFTDSASCVQYGAHGGQLVPLAVAAPCLQGGYLTVARLDGSAFTSQAECVAYVADGGALVRKPQLTVQAQVPTPLSFTVTVTGTGFAPNSQVTVTLAGVTIFSTTAATDGNGSFTAVVSAICTIPSTIGTFYQTVTATDSAGNTVSVPLAASLPC